jgi:hypothetical protein
MTKVQIVVKYFLGDAVFSWDARTEVDAYLAKS